MASNILYTQVLTDLKLRRKCLGIAKNYFTKALKNDPTKVVFPQYPYIF